VGFGIATPADARAVAGFADGVVVGSAAVRVIERAVGEGRDPVPALEAFVRDLRAALVDEAWPQPSSSAEKCAKQGTGARAVVYG